MVLNAGLFVCCVKGIVEWFRSYKGRKYSVLSGFFLKIGLTANVLTFLSLFSGLVCVYFLFSNRLLFIVFALLHLFFDFFDGVVARDSVVTEGGFWLDHLTDRVVEFFLVIKVFLFSPSFLVVLLLLLIVITNLIYFANQSFGILNSRTILVVTFILGLFNLGVIIALVVAFISLCVQFSNSPGNVFKS